LLLSSSHRFHRSRCSSRTTPTTATSPSDIHDSYLPLLYFFLKKLVSIFSFQANVRSLYNYRWMSIGQRLLFFVFVILIQRQVWTCKQTNRNRENNHQNTKIMGCSQAKIEPEALTPDDARIIRETWKMVSREAYGEYGQRLMLR
jgi:hypothetical protein